MQTGSGFSMGMAIGLLVVVLVLLLGLTVVPVGEESRPILDIRLGGS